MNAEPGRDLSDGPIWMPPPESQRRDGGVARAAARARGWTSAPVFWLVWALFIGVSQIFMALRYGWDWGRYLLLAGVCFVALVHGRDLVRLRRQARRDKRDGAQPGADLDQADGRDDRQPVHGQRDEVR